MRCLSLHQPWATAMVMGLKSIETRSWSTPYRGLIAIHAAKNMTALKDGSLEELREDVPQLPRDAAQYPLGVIVAIGMLADCERTDEMHPEKPERDLGNYSDGRFGWIFTKVVAVPFPLPFRGMQGLFNLPLDLSSTLIGLFDRARGVV